MANASVKPNNAADGATTILYSGRMPDGTHTGTLAEAMSDASVKGNGLKEVVTIADTGAYKILQSEVLEDAWLEPLKPAANSRFQARVRTRAFLGAILT